MKCPKCGDTENIKFFIRHQKIDENDESTNGNCITILHADPECGFNSSYLLSDCLEVIFPDWSKKDEIQEDQNSIDIGGILTAMAGGMVGMGPDIGPDGENELPPIQEPEDIDNKAIELDRIEDDENND